MNFNAYALQLGVDVYQNEEQGGSRSYVGPYVTIGSANANTSSQSGGISTGSINGMQAYSLGLYGTHFASNGLYVDALAQGTRYLNAGAGSVQGVNRYQYPRHLPTSLGTAVQILPEKAHCCNYGV